MLRYKDFLSVSGLVVVLFYSWSLYRFLQIVPAWLMFLDASQILVLFAQTLIVSLIDSLIVLLGVISLALLLPARWYRDELVLRGGSTVIVLFLLALYLAFHAIPLERLLLFYIPGAAVVLIFLQIFFRRVPALAMYLETLADRSIIFLYLYVPLSLISLIVLLVRK